jgi:hypothetical protein
MIKVPESTIGVLDHSGGILRANKALSAFQVKFCSKIHFLSNITGSVWTAHLSVAVCSVTLSMA